MRVLKLIAEALNISAETLLEQAGLLDGQAPTAPTPPPRCRNAIRADQRLSEEQKAALIAVYHSVLHE